MKREFWLLLGVMKYQDTGEWCGRIFDNEDAARNYKVYSHERVVHVVVPPTGATARTASRAKHPGLRGGSKVKVEEINEKVGKGPYKWTKLGYKITESKKKARKK